MTTRKRTKLLDDFYRLFFTFINTVFFTKKNFEEFREDSFLVPIYILEVLLLPILISLSI